MEALAARYADDVEARIFYALALDQTALPTDKTYANQLKAAGILEAEFTRQPDHPGLAHYIIHSFDVPPLAPRALDAARRYAKIAPDAPHALHMPSHTFTRVGFWQESIDANLASAAAARKDNATAEELHALDYQAYAYLQTAQDAAARRTLDAIGELAAKIQTAGAGNAAPPTAGYYALAAIPARLRARARRVGRGGRAARTPDADSPGPTRSRISPARSAPREAATPPRRRRTSIGSSPSATRSARPTMRTGPSRSRFSAARPPRGSRSPQASPTKALTLMREAADREDATDKSAVTPGPIKPARELLGDMLMQLKRPAEALVAFETTLKKEPNRFRAIYGAARAAAAAGQRQKASAYYASLLKIAARADSRAEPSSPKRAARNPPWA